LEDFRLEYRFDESRPAFEQASEQYFVVKAQGKQTENFIRQIGQDFHFPLITGQTQQL
jgi:hypothetical protein